MLQGLGWIIEGFASGEPAIKAFEASGGGKGFDLCILDLTLPGRMDGVQIAKRLREIDKNAVIMVSCGYSEDAAISRPEEHGFDGVLPKPYTIAELRGALARCLAKAGKI